MPLTPPRVEKSKLMVKISGRDIFNGHLRVRFFAFSSIFDANSGRKQILSRRC